jgi:hypothetical protein
MERLKQDETVFRALFTCSIRPSARSARLGRTPRNHRRSSPTAVGPAGQRSGEHPGVWRGWSQRSGPSRARAASFGAARPATDGGPSPCNRPCDRPWNRPRPGGGAVFHWWGRGRRRRRAGGEGACRRGDGPSPARDGSPEKIRRTLNFAIDSPGRLRYKPRHTGRASPLARDDDQSVGRAATQTRRLVILKRWAHSSVGRAADS